MPRKGDWDDLSASSRRRWSTAGKAHGVTGREYYESGARLTKAERGHARTPEAPERALRNPERYPTYLSKPENLRKVNALAKERGEKRVGLGRSGVKAVSREGRKDPGSWTYVLSPEQFEDHTGSWSSSTRTRSLSEAQAFARSSGAPPGTVIIVKYERPDDVPVGESFWGYTQAKEVFVLWYSRDSSPKGRAA